MIEKQRKGGPTFLRRAGGLLIKYNVTALFLVLCAGCFLASSRTLPSLLDELFTRIGRNTFLVLSLLIPVAAGLGLNFGIVIGAMSAQIAIFIVVLFGGGGLSGLLMCVLLCTPLSVLFGWLVGKLFNSMKGTEMIGGLVAGYFSDGLYQLLFLYILGGVIPVNNRTLMISTGVGVKNVINLEKNLKYALDNISLQAILTAAFWAALAAAVLLAAARIVRKQPLPMKKALFILAPLGAAYGLSFIPAANAFLSAPRQSLLNVVLFGAAGAALYQAAQLIRAKLAGAKPWLSYKRLVIFAFAAAAYALTYTGAARVALSAVRLPVLTYLVIAGLYLLIPWFMNTKLGQDMRTVGHDRSVALSSGINVDRVRIIAMILSTVLASYGQLISLQNIGTVATYGSHMQVGLYAIAALLVGGATVQYATANQAVLGIVLFHTLFILSTDAGKNLLGNAQIGEYFRVFMAYGVIALALAMDAWGKSQSARRASEGSGAPASPDEA